jgi:putative DNA primase/helicase
VIPFEQYDIGEHRLTCPACGRGPRDRTLGLTVRADRSAVVHCFRCDYCETYHPKEGAQVTAPSKLIKGRQQGQQHATLSDYGRDLWSRCKPLSGVALDYLKARRCVIPPKGSDLRWHPNLKHPDPATGYIGPCMVARITDALTGEPLSLHRTWVRADGKKADIDAPRLLLGGHRKQGGVIRLWPVEAGTTTLGIAEGIETALSLARAVQPVWSLIDSGNLSAFPVLPSIEKIFIARDNDAAGISASLACGTRWAWADRETYIVAPTAFEHNDLNDIPQGSTA